MRLPNRLFPLVIGVMAVLAVLPAAASADMEIGMQDDLTILDGFSSRELALQQFVEMGGTHVRMTVDHKRGRRFDRDTSFASRRPAERYEQAIDAILDKGLEPQITLWWRGQTKPRLVSRWMGNVAERFGSKVDRYSIGNEPDLYEVERRRCNARTKRALRRKFPDLVRRGGRRMKVETGGTVSVRTACLRYQRGLTYRRTFPRAARAIRRANSQARVMAGETSPLRGLDYFFLGARAHRLPADGWAHHPFQFDNLNPAKATKTWGIGNLKLLKRTVRMPIYLTEFGYPRPHSSMDRREYGRRLSEREVARALTKAFKVARRGRARQMLQYQWFEKPEFRTEFWDTALMDDDNGETSPAYRSLKRLINRWNR